MGWFGYGIYGGDETQSWHYDFLVWAKIAKNEDEVFEKELVGKKLSQENCKLLKKNWKLIFKKLPKINSDVEYGMLARQMLLALFLDNKIKPPFKVFKIGVLATKYLMEDHADDFTNPGLRRRNLKNFIDKAENLYYTKH